MANKINHIEALTQKLTKSFSEQLNLKKKVDEQQSSIDNLNSANSKFKSEIEKLQSDIVDLKKSQKETV